MINFSVTVNFQVLLNSYRIKYELFQDAAV